MTIHDYTDRENWSDEINNWDRFDRRDLVIGPGYGSFKSMVVVHEIDPSDSLDKITHKGVFWDKSEADAYAEERHERTHREVEDD